MHFQSHVVLIKLDIHLLCRQNVYFRDRQECQAVENAIQTKSLTLFELNQSDPSAHRNSPALCVEKFTKKMENKKMWMQQNHQMHVCGLTKRH